MRRPSVTTALAAACVFSQGHASGFSHVVKPGETLAQIADRVYGDAKLETVLVGANALDAQGGTVIAPGMHLEIPAPGHHTVMPGETWSELAVSWLGTGDMARAELLAHANKGVPWVPPIEGQEIEVPAVLSYIAGDNETINAIAQKFWGDGNRGWELNVYNRRGNNAVAVRRGEAVLVPMPRLRLTETGKAEARAAAERDGASGGMALEQQRRAEGELPQLLADVRYGRYAEAVARGNRLLGGAPLTHPQLAVVHRALLEAYVALDARAAASAACTAWRSNEPNPSLNPARVSPKVRAACGER